MKELFAQFHEIMNKIYPIKMDESASLFEIFYFQGISKDHHFTAAGEIPKNIGIILKGVFRYYYLTPDGTEYTKQFCSEGQLIVSYSAAIQNQTSPFYIQALEDSDILSASFNDYIEKIESFSWGQKALRTEAENILAIKISRESDLLLLNAKERYTKFIKEHSDLVNRVNQYHIASYLEIEPEILSQIK